MELARSLTKKIVRTYEEAGIHGIARKSKGYLQQRIYFKRFIWLERDLSLPISDMPAKTVGQAVFDSQKEVIEWVKTKIYNGNPYDDEIYENSVAHENGHFFNYVEVNNKIVCSQKIAVNDVYIKNYARTFRLREATAFSYAFYTDPEFRNLGLASFLMTESMKFLRSNGVKKIGGHVLSSNFASLRMLEKTGFRQICSNWQSKFFGINVYNELPQLLFVR